MEKKLIYIDLDDTLADFCEHLATKGQKPPEVSKMYEPGFFFNLKPIEGSLAAVRSLIYFGYDVQILSQPVAESAHSYSEKVQWIGIHFPELIKKINFTQDKGLFKGDYLIDDNEKKWKEAFEKNGGEFVHFDYQAEHRLQWHFITQSFKNKAGK